MTHHEILQPCSCYCACMRTSVDSNPTAVRQRAVVLADKRPVSGFICQLFFPFSWRSSWHATWSINILFVVLFTHFLLLTKCLPSWPATAGQCRSWLVVQHMAQNALQREWGNFPFANWNGICWGLLLQLVQLKKVHFCPIGIFHVRTEIWKESFHEKSYTNP